MQSKEHTYSPSLLAFVVFVIVIGYIVFDFFSGTDLPVEKNTTSITEVRTPKLLP